MAAGVLIVRSEPDEVAEISSYHRWYDETHLPELLALPGFVSARRFANDDGRSFTVIYELDDIDAARAAMTRSRETGALSAPVNLRLDPPPAATWCSFVASTDRPDDA